MAIEEVDGIFRAGVGDRTSLVNGIGSQSRQPADGRLFEEKLASEGANSAAVNPAPQLYAFNDTSGQNKTITDVKPADVAPKPQETQPSKWQPNAPEWSAPPQEPGFSFKPAFKAAGRIGGAICAYFSDIPGLNGVKEGNLAGGVRYKYDGGTGELSLRTGNGDLNLSMKAGRDGVFRTPDGGAAARYNPQTRGLELEFNAGFLKKLETPEGRARIQQQAPTQLQQPQPFAAPQTDTQTRDGRTCTDIGSWEPENTNGRSPNAIAYQGFVTHHPGEDFAVPRPGNEPLRYDGCQDTPAGPLLQEAKADHNGNIGEEWFGGKDNIVNQGQKQQATATQLGVPVQWYTQTAQDRADIKKLFENAQPPVTIPVTHLPMPVIK